MKMTISEIGKYLADLVAPNRCPACSRLIPWNKLMCDKCRDKLPVISGELCSVCGKRPCTDHAKLRFENCVCLFYYTDLCVNAIYSLKYSGGINFAEYSAQLLKTELKSHGLAQKIDLVTSVPMSKRKKRKRGYNQSEMIAKYLSRGLGKPLDTGLLVHSDSLTDQHKLAKKQRAQNAQDSLYPSRNGADIKGKTVLLCDDVYTTGATMNACASCLKRLGAKSVIAVAIATPVYTENRFEQASRSERT